MGDKKVTPLDALRQEIEAGMSSRCWRRLCDHHLHAAIDGEEDSTKLILWLMTRLDESLLHKCINRALLRRLISRPKRVTMSERCRRARPHRYFRHSR